MTQSPIKGQNQLLLEVENKSLETQKQVGGKESTDKDKAITNTSSSQMTSESNSIPINSYSDVFFAGQPFANQLELPRKVNLLGKRKRAQKAKLPKFL